MIFADVRTWLLSNGCGRNEMKCMVNQDVTWDKNGKIILCYILPLFLNESFFLVDCLTCIVTSFFPLLLKQSSLSKNWKWNGFVEEKAFFSGEKKTFCMFFCPLCFVSLGHSYQSVHCLKRKDTPPHTHVTHKLWRRLICMNMCKFLYH